MIMVFDKPIKIERLNENGDDEKWEDFAVIHARVNKSGGNTYLKAGAERSQNSLVFECRYSSLLEKIRFDTQLYRLFYRGNRYKVEDYDDFEERHETIKLLGVSY